MASLNKVIIAGNLTKDVESRFTPKGTAVAKLSIAINRTWRDESGQKKEECTFVDVDVWGKSAENCAQYLRKGAGVLVDGRLKLESWEKDGKKFSKLGVTAENVQFLGGKEVGEAAPAPQPKSAEAPKSKIDDSDLPPF